MPYSVLHILGTARTEGNAIARVVALLSRGLDPRRFELHAWFMKEAGPLVSELGATGVKVRVIPWHGRRDPLGALRFWRALRRENFAILHQHYGGRTVRWLARRATRAKILLQLHTRVWEPRGLNPIPIEIHDADLTIADSRAVAGQVLNVRPEVVYLGVPVPSFPAEGFASPREGTDLVIGTAGRLAPVKGVLYAIRALAELHADFPELRLEIAGSGPEQAALEEEARSLGLAPQVRFLGWRSDLREVMAGWDVFVLPSIDEGFPLAALEAMGAGLPVVATAVGGVPELVEDARTGWLVPSGDPQALAGRLRILLKHPEQRLAMGAAGRARVGDHFSVERMVAAVAKIYDRFMDSQCRPNPGRP